MNLLLRLLPMAQVATWPTLNRLSSVLCMTQLHKHATKQTQFSRTRLSGGASSRTDYKMRTEQTERGLAESIEQKISMSITRLSQ